MSLRQVGGRDAHCAREEKIANRYAKLNALDETLTSAVEAVDAGDNWLRVAVAGRRPRTPARTAGGSSRENCNPPGLAAHSLLVRTFIAKGYSCNLITTPHQPPARSRWRRAHEET